MRIDDRRVILSTETGGSSWKGGIREVGNADTFQEFSLELPGNPRSLGEDNFAKNLGAWLQAVGVTPTDLDHTFFAIAGYDTPEDLEVIKRAMTKVGFQADKPAQEIHNDMFIGIAPFSQDQYPIRVAGISGTGTNWGASVYGVERLRVAGGTGALLSDMQGGGFGIGLKGLQYVANCLLDEGMVGDTPQSFQQILSRCPQLVQRICKTLDLNSMDAVIGLTVPHPKNGWGDNVQKIAKAALIVAEESRRTPLLEPGDRLRDTPGIEKSVQILQATGEYLGDRFSSVYKKAHESVGGEPAVHLTLLGNVIKDENSVVRGAFNAAIRGNGIDLLDNRFTIEAFGNTIPLHRENLARIARTL